MSEENKPEKQGGEKIEVAKEESVKIVKNASRAGGNGSFSYSYASLGDMAKQGVKIPQMRTHIERNPITGAIDGEYIEYFDGEAWQIGSRIVRTELRGGGNAAQQYGASLTYSRRYTTAMAAAIATDDDDKIEQDGVSRKGYNKSARPERQRIDFDTLRAEAAKFTDVDALRKWYAGIIQHNRPTEKMKVVMDRIVTEAADKLKAAAPAEVPDDAPAEEDLRAAGLL